VPRPNRGARLERNDRGVYEVRWTEGGRSRRVSTRTADATEAAAFFAAWGADVEKEADQASAATVRGVLAAYFEEHVARKVIAQGTAEIARKHLLAHFGGMAPADIRPADVRAYCRKRERGEIGRKVVGATIRRELVVLTAALAHAVSEHRLPRGSAPVIALPPDSAPCEDWLREDEVAALFKAAAQDRPEGRLSRVERWLFIAYHTGRRAAAIETLTWDRVDFAASTINFDVPGRARTKKRRGTAYMNATLRGVLERAYAERDEASPYVLDTPGKIRKPLAALGARAGVPRVHPHLLKHTCVTHLLRRGVKVWDTAGAVATSAATIERVYGKHVPEAQRTAMETLG
jgi:integrase